MEYKKIEAIIEAILFASGDEVSSDSLCKILQLDKKTLYKVINNMIDKYNAEKRGIQIIQIEDSFQMCTSPDYYDYIKQLREPRHKSGLSQAALETLAIIAYKQPITKAAIDQIRGVSSYNSILKLLEKNLIKEVGRADAPGKPILYGTTEEFLRSFGLKTIKELPILDMFNNMPDMSVQSNDELYEE